MASESTTPSGNGDMPFAKHLFEAADRLRGSVESAEYKHLVLGLLFLKYVSDSFQLRRNQLEAETRKPKSGVYTEDEGERQEILEDRDEYAAENVFWVPVEARWDALLAAAAQPDVGVRIDRALEAVERENTSLRGVLPHVYARAALSPEKLGELVTTIAKIGFGENAEEARDVLGRTYEYFIKTFARAEGHRGGEFYTPASVTRLIVEMLEPFKGRVYEPAFGSGGLFVQSGRFVQAHGGRTADIALYGQENSLDLDSPAPVSPITPTTSSCFAEITSGLERLGGTTFGDGPPANRKPMSATDCRLATSCSRWIVRGSKPDSSMRSFGKPTARLCWFSASHDCAPDQPSTRAF